MCPRSTVTMMIWEYRSIHRSRTRLLVVETYSAWVSAKLTRVLLLLLFSYMLWIMILVLFFLWSTNVAAKTQGKLAGLNQSGRWRIQDLEAAVWYLIHLLRKIGNVCYTNPNPIKVCHPLHSMRLCHVMLGMWGTRIGLLGVSRRYSFCMMYM